MSESQQKTEPITFIPKLGSVHHAKMLAYNAILKFSDNGPMMLRNAPIMLKVLALFLSNHCIYFDRK